MSDEASLVLSLVIVALIMLVPRKRATWRWDDKEKKYRYMD